MSIQEKRAIVSIITTVITFAVYYTFIMQMYQGDAYTTTEELKFWGATILILIPVMIVAKIVLYILYSIINTIITKKREEEFLTDEYGRLIESKATRNFYFVFMVGFFAAMGTLVLEMAPVVMFNIILLSVLLGGIVVDISSIYYLRKGI